MKGIITSEKTVSVNHMDYIKCDGCGVFLNMNRHVRDRMNRYNISDPAIVETPTYMEVTVYPSCDDDVERFHYCEDCAGVWLKKMFGHCEFKCDLEISTGMVIVPEISVIEQEIVAESKSQNTTDSCEHATVGIDFAAVAEEESARYKRLFGENA